MKIFMLFVAGLLSCSSVKTAFQKEATCFQEEAESYYLLQTMIAKEFAYTNSLDRYKTSSLQSLEFITAKDHDLLGWTKIEKDSATGAHFGLCITPVYGYKKKKLGYIVGKYRFQTNLKESAIASLENSLFPILHEKLKYSHSLVLLRKR